MSRRRWVAAVGVAAMLVAHVVLLHRVATWIAVPAAIAAAGIIVVVLAHVGARSRLVRRRDRSREASGRDHR